MIARTHVVRLRVTEAEHETWTKSAGGNLSDWLRGLANSVTRIEYLRTILTEAEIAALLSMPSTPR